MKKRIINFDKEAFQSKIKSLEYSPWPYVIMLIMSLLAFVGCVVPAFNALVADPEYITTLTENNRNLHIIIEFSCIAVMYFGFCCFFAFYECLGKIYMLTHKEKNIEQE